MTRRLKALLFLLFLAMPGTCLPQYTLSDTILGRPAMVREKLVFLDSSRQVQKLWPTESVWGHYGFVSPDFTLKRFWQAWHHLPFVHYVNYKRQFNKDGLLIREEWYNEKDEAVHRYAYRYDTAHNKVLEESYLYDSLFSTTAYHYRPDKKPVTQLEYFREDKNRFYLTVYRYDTAGYLVEQKEFDEYGESYGRKYLLDAENRIVLDLTHSPCVYKTYPDSSIHCERDGQGVDWPNKQYIYDSAGRLVKELFFSGTYDNHSRLANCYWYGYDDRGNKISEGYGRNRIESRRTWLYDDHNRVIREVFETPGNERSIHQIEYTYDPMGNITRVIYTDERYRSELTFTYRFDKRGNWTEQVRSENGKPLYVLRRDISYSE